MTTALDKQSSSPDIPPNTISLETCPSIFVLPTHLNLDELHDLEERLTRCAAPLTYDIDEAKLVLGKVSQKKRAALELRLRGLWTEEIPTKDSEPPQKKHRISSPNVGTEPVKEPQVVDLSQETEDDDDEKRTTKVLKPPKIQPDDSSFLEVENAVRVVKLDWLNQSLKADRILPVGPFTVYYAQKVPRPELPKYGKTVSDLSTDLESITSSPQSPFRQKDGQSRGIMERAKADATSSPQPTGPPHRGLRRDGRSATPTKRPPPKLYRETTSEHDIENPLPSPPDWVSNNVLYACQRSAFLHPPNETFINQLLKIKKVRELTLDEIGVRAYSTSIAAIAAYPYAFRTPAEVQSLPGCESKIATLFSEWKQSTDGTLETANQLDTDPVLKTLGLFNDIWGVGAKSARDFYYRNHWRSLDDIVEQGWDSLSRVQQIGVKYYDEFTVGIPRDEVKAIGDVVLEHAKRVRSGSDYDGKGVECIIVGGYRRGKQYCGDVDLVISHRDRTVTHNLIYDIVASLEQEGWITHTLALHLTNTNRDQQTLPYRGESSGKPRFDSLDKALVVWQDPHFDDPEPSDEGEQSSSTEQDEKETESTSTPAQSDDPSSKSIKQKLKKVRQKPKPRISATARKRNPNPHRRVDVIISPWRTVGCAVLGWSGDTTFERDLRRYAKKVHNWKFDSSGVRAREGSGGRVIDLESAGETWQERERLVMEGLGVRWRPPEERCTR